MTAVDLIEELLTAATPEELFRLLEDERFHSVELARVLLDASTEVQLQSPGEGLRLARIAGHLTPHLRPPEVSAGILVSAGCLQGNAFRLAGELELAAEAYVSTVPWLDTLGGKGDFARGLGLVRWEQGRNDEAMALLDHADTVYGNYLPAERATARLLLGVLLLEVGYPQAAAEVLSKLSGPPVEFPALAARAALGLAFGVNPELPDHAVRTSFFLEQGMSFYPRLGREEEELNHLLRLEARVKAKLGRTSEARELLEGLRRHHLEARDLPELALATFDLLALQAGASEMPCPAAFRNDLAGFEPEEGGSLARMALDRMFSKAGANPWDASFDAGAWLLRMLRFHRIPTRPIPFV